MSTVNLEQYEELPPVQSQSGGHPKQALDQASVCSEMMIELEDAARLNTSRRINRLYQEFGLGAHIKTFKEAVLRAMRPIKSGRQKPTREAHYFIMDETLEDITDEGFLDEYIKKFSLESLDAARSRVHDLIECILEHPEYVEAVDFYKKQRQSALYRNTLYDFLSMHDFRHVAHVNSKTPLYHGIGINAAEDYELDSNEPDALLSPVKYVKKLRSILDNGIEAGRCHDNLPELESVFCVDNPRDAYGLIALRFFLDSREKVWAHSYGGFLENNFGARSSEGYQLVVPVVKPPVVDGFEVLIRSSAFYNNLKKGSTSDVFSKLSPAQHFQYISKLAKHLQRQNIPFKMLDPDGRTRNPREDLLLQE